MVSDGFVRWPPGLAFSWFRPPRYGAVRGLIVGEPVVTLATPEYFFRLPEASLTSTL